MVEDYQENYGNGWIKLYRSLDRHWLWENPRWFQWWIKMLFEANHASKKITIGYQIHELSAGQSAKSLRTWAAMFGSGVKETVKFFDLLENDKMITRTTLGKGKQSTTLINITNYSKYQGKTETLKDTLKGTLKDTQGKRNGGTNNNDNNDKEGKNKRQTKFAKPTLKDISDYCKERDAGVSAYKFYNYYESNGWRVGKNPMKDWKAAVRTWEQRETNSTSIATDPRSRK